MSAKTLESRVFLSLATTFCALSVVATGQAVSSTPTNAGTDLVSPQVILDTQKPPIFPPAALAARYSGSVMLEIVVLPDGQVGEARVVECSRPRVGFEESAVAAVKAWRFEPGRKGNEPVEFTLRFRLNFKPEGVGNDPQPRVTAGAISADAKVAPARSGTDTSR